ncbi:DNA polymerase alpha subunit B-like [Mytilus edulis]|uniref:DNA polymerase alpha subunit B-like n=1 Tax=Mytilus edulis TaxID=6550 RepID=UPI0039EF139B
MPFISEEELEDEFSVFGVEFSSPQIVEKLQELCVQYNLGAEKIVTEWVAFASTHKGVQMTLDSLDQLDRERLTKKGSKTPKTPARTNTIKQEYYDINTIQGGMDENEAENLYNAYSTTPSSKKGTNQQKRQLTPDNPPLKRFTNISRSPMVPFSPASFSPAGATPSGKFSSRTNAGQVVAHFGVTDNTKWQGHGQTSSIQLYDEEYKLTTSFKYMFQKLVDKAHVLNDTIDYMAEKLQSHYQIEELSHVAVPMQEPVTVAGRICCDANGKMNAKSVLLEGSRDTSMGKYIPIDLAELKQFSLFPGQLVAMDGINNTGQKLVVNKIFEGVAQSLPEIKVKTEPGSDKLSVLIAAGPFSTSDNLSYEPLNELTKNISKDKPDVCILLGPFVDMKNEVIEKGNCKMSYDTIFNEQLKFIGTITKSVGCQVIVVPSYRDVHHDYVYPQPPFDVKMPDFKHMHMMSDPCTVSINNIVFGITSTDILMHLGAEEISWNPPTSTDRLGRLAQHLITQHSYYPLYPPSDEVNIDYEALDTYGTLPVTPHVLILPSDLKQFIKELHGSFCINPGRVAKGQIGGSYARMMINVNDVKTQSSVVQHTAAQVLRV